MKPEELKKIIKEEVIKALKEAESPLYTDWEEHVNPDRIVVHLKDGRKLQISKKHIAGGSKVYQAILQAFIDDRTDITNKVVGAMSAMKEGTFKKESINEGPYWGQPITAKDIPGYEKLATNLVNKLGTVDRKVIKKFSTPMGVIKVVAEPSKKTSTGNTKPEIKRDGYLLANLIDTDTMYVDVTLLTPSQQMGSDSNVDAMMYISFKK
jgi:hypothetical protein